VYERTFKHKYRHTVAVINFDAAIRQNNLRHSVAVAFQPPLFFARWRCDMWMRGEAVER